MVWRFLFSSTHEYKAILKCSLSAPFTSLQSLQTARKIYRGNHQIIIFCGSHTFLTKKKKPIIVPKNLFDLRRTAVVHNLHIWARFLEQSESELATSSI